jgi:hypothetical protein
MPRWIHALAALGTALGAGPLWAATPRVEIRERRTFQQPPALSSAGGTPLPGVVDANVGADGSAPSASGVVVATNFVFVPDADSLGNLVCAPGLDGAGQLATTLSTLLPSLGLDPQLVVVLATRPLICGDIFYRALANDIRGIGYQHEATGELFDQTPDSRLEGMAFLNDFPYWQAHPAEFQNDFDHELGHRWGARVHAQIDGADSTELLGRDLQHWSYFLNSGGSPLEGNIWTELGSGQYQADTPLGPGTFSELDLYDMGVLPVAAVGPQQLLRPGAAPAATDCLGQTLGATSPPQSCRPYETPATPVTFTIDDVIASEGERDPPAVAGPVTVDIAVVVLGTGNQPFDLATCQAMTASVPARIADFATASGGQVLLNNLVAAGSDCAIFTSPAPAAATSAGGGCAVAPPRPSALVLGLLALAVLRSRARRRS